MSEALASSLGIVAYLALFFFAALSFIFINLIVGKLLRPHDPHAEKLEIYECGEPTIGSSFVQFDLRFYVVALLFIIFDVEVAFFFPWATVFGKATNLADTEVVVVAQEGDQLVLQPAARGILREMGVANPGVPEKPPEFLVDKIRREYGDAEAERLTSAAAAETVVKDGARALAWFTLTDILAFFGVLMVGFLYVWKRGDLDWVRALTRQRGQERPARGEAATAGEPVLSA